MRLELVPLLLAPEGTTGVLLGRARAPRLDTRVGHATPEKGGGGVWSQGVPSVPRLRLSWVAVRGGTAEKSLVAGKELLEDVGASLIQLVHHVDVVLVGCAQGGLLTLVPDLPKLADVVTHDPVDEHVSPVAHRRSALPPYGDGGADPRRAPGLLTDFVHHMQVSLQLAHLVVVIRRLVVSLREVVGARLHARVARRSVLVKVTWRRIGHTERPPGHVCLAGIRLDATFD